MLNLNSKNVNNENNTNQTKLIDLKKNQLITSFTSIDSVPQVNKEQPKIEHSDYDLNPRPTSWITLFVMSIVGILAVILHFRVNHTQHKEATNPDTNIITKSQNKKQGIQSIQRFSNYTPFIESKCSKMITEHISFAIFEHGSCVLLREPLKRPKAAAKSSLKLLFDPNMDFQVTSLDNNNYLITFNDYLFYWFPAESLANNKDIILLDPRLNRNDTDSKKINTLSDFELRIGKLARLNLKADNEKLLIKKIIRSKQNTPENPTIESKNTTLHAIPISPESNTTESEAK